MTEPKQFPAIDYAPITGIVLMADYGACLWDESGAAIWLDELRWPEALQQRIDGWERYYWLRLDAPENFDSVYLDSEGRLIALVIKALVGTEIRVTHKTFNQDLVVIDC